MTEQVKNNPQNTVKQSFWQTMDLRAIAPFVALGVLLIFGTIVNSNFIGIDNLTNIATRSAFIAIIAIGATFVISSGGLDLSVGSMSAFVAAVTILFMNSGIVSGILPMLLIAACLAIVTGALCGLANGMMTTIGRIEPFIVTLGTMGIFRALTIYLAEGGSIAMKSQELRARGTNRVETPEEETAGGDAPEQDREEAGGRAPIEDDLAKGNELKVLGPS